METSPALIAMAQQIAAQQAEIDRLQRELDLTKNRKPKKQTEEELREERAIRWMAKEYERMYQAAIKKHMPRIREIQKRKPGWMPTNDCLELTLNGNKKARTGTPGQ